MVDGAHPAPEARRGLLWPLSSALLVAAAAATALVLGWLDAGGPAASVAIAAFTIAAFVVSLRLSRRAHRAETLALRDALTGLPNRALLDDRIDRVLERAHRDGDAFAVLVVDLDGFKEVNDVRGHDAGDSVLQSIARRLGGVVRASDTVARVGGDEFVVLSPGTNDDAEATVLAERIRLALRRPYRVDGNPIEIDASIGWALFPRDGGTSEALLARADDKMYATKRRDEPPVTQRRPRLDAGVVREVESALRRRELVVHYQPVIRIPDGDVVAVEALVRRVHPERGLVGPLSFVPHVERTPMIRQLTLHVVDAGLRAVESWSARGHDLELSVNVPYRMIGDGELVDGLARRLAEARVRPGALTLEISPSRAGAPVEPLRPLLETFAIDGVRLSLDDVGRASSLAALSVLPLHEMKIDGTLVRGAGRDGRDTAVVRALVALGHDLGLRVVAEGLEHRDHLDAMAMLGCDRGQGYYVARPLPAAELGRWLDDGWPAAALAG